MTQIPSSLLIVLVICPFSPLALKLLDRSVLLEDQIWLPSGLSTETVHSQVPDAVRLLSPHTYVKM